MTWNAAVKLKEEIIPATIKSGHREADANTPAAAIITAKLPIASFRLQSQIERILESPVR